jgi:hypothetical protein
MQILSRFLRAPAAHKQQAAAAAPTSSDSDAVRRQLIDMALRDVLRMHGIPREWLTVRSSSASGPRKAGVYLRIGMTNADPALPGYSVAIQSRFKLRLQRLDPLSVHWLKGISWEFDFADEGACAALPDAGHWERHAPVPGPAPARSNAREVLERLMAESSDRFRAEPTGGRAAAGFAQTQPMGL